MIVCIMIYEDNNKNPTYFSAKLNSFTIIDKLNWWESNSYINLNSLIDAYTLLIRNLWIYIADDICDKY